MTLLSVEAFERSTRDSGSLAAASRVLVIGLLAVVLAVLSAGEGDAATARTHRWRGSGSTPPQRRR
jgi:hypothetical protein